MSIQERNNVKDETSMDMDENGHIGHAMSVESVDGTATNN